jgi:hypothetical protein
MTMIDEETIDEDTAAEHIHGICLKTGPPRSSGWCATPAIRRCQCRPSV